METSVLKKKMRNKKKREEKKRAGTRGVTQARFCPAVMKGHIVCVYMCVCMYVCVCVCV